jgi:hypothetical protein
MTMRGGIDGMDGRVGREPQYDLFADEFLDHAEGGFFNAYYDRPACLALLGDVAGKRVLDAACGPGLYAGELVSRGAQVVGFDQSPRMVEICRARVGQGDFRIHDLGDPIDWLPDGCVELALCALAIEYVDDRVGALSELRRVLRPGGACWAECRFRTSCATVSPISSGLSSWMKCRPLTVVSVRLGHVRMSSRRRSLMTMPGSAATVTTTEPRSATSMAMAAYETARPAGCSRVWPSAVAFSCFARYWHFRRDGVGPGASRLTTAAVVAEGLPRPWPSR